MYIPLTKIAKKYSLNIKGVIEVGAHWGEEHEILLQAGATKIVYIEPCKDAFKVLQDKFGNDENVILLNVACSNEEGEMEMYVSNDNQGQSNSLLKPALHLRQHPNVVFNETEIVLVTTLDSIPLEMEQYNVLVMDAQGSEGHILKGAVNTLPHIDVIYAECNRGQTYEGNMEIEEMDKYLEAFGFVRTDTYWPSPNLTWGDCVFIRKSLLNVG